MRSGAIQTNRADVQDSIGRHRRIHRTASPDFVRRFVHNATQVADAHSRRYSPDFDEPAEVPCLRHVAHRRHDLRVRNGAWSVDATPSIPRERRPPSRLSTVSTKTTWGRNCDSSLDLQLCLQRFSVSIGPFGFGSLALAFVPKRSDENVGSCGSHAYPAGIPMLERVPNLRYNT